MTERLGGCDETRVGINGEVLGVVMIVVYNNTPTKELNHWIGSLTFISRKCLYTRLAIARVGTVRVRVPLTY